MNTISDANGLFSRIVSIGNVIVYLLIGLGLVFIIWNIVWYFIRGSDDVSRGKSGLNILWGVVGLAVIMSLWGLVNILLVTFNTNNNAPRDRFPTANFLSNQTTP